MKITILLIILGINHLINAQIRNKATTYLELGIGTPIFFNDALAGKFSIGERDYHIGFAFGNKSGNYNRLLFDTKKEFVKDSKLELKNLSLKYAYEKTIYKGHHHMSYLGILYGLGVGLETIGFGEGPNAQSKVYLLGSTGLNYEKFLSRGAGLFTRLSVDLTPMSISANIKGTFLIGLKAKI